jgi:hypothetical protein
VVKGNLLRGTGRYMNRKCCRAATWTGRLCDSGGSVALFVLFVCLAIASLTQLMTVAILCCERARSDEVAGRRRLAEVDTSLSELRGRAGAQWTPVPWSSADDAGRTLRGRLVESGDSPEWIMRAEVSDETTEEHRVTSALVERGRDGLDLPRAALVAASVWSTTGRQTPWLVADSADAGATETAVVYAKTVREPQAVGANCSVEHLARDWGLGDGWLESLKSESLSGPRLFVIKGQKGEVVSPPDQALGSSRDLPVLLVGLGGVCLDLRGVGELWGVVVADEGSVQLDHTIVRGAVFASDHVDFGDSGQLVYCSDVLLWATDRSLQRVRLVPGTRLEDTE